MPSHEDKQVPLRRMEAMLSTKHYHVGGSCMCTVKLLDESQVCICSRKIIHRSPFYPGGATGSWWSGSAKTPNWRRRSAAARSQRGQMPLLMYHVFKAGQQCVCAWAWVGGERTECLPRHSHIDANLTHAWVLPTVCVTISSSLTDPWGVLSFPFSSHAVLCQDWSWHLLTAVQPISGKILSGGRCWILCWQQAIAAECQFRLTNLYNRVFAVTVTISHDHVLSFLRNRCIGDALNETLILNPRICPVAAHKSLSLRFQSPCNTCQKCCQLPGSKSENMGRLCLI